MNERIKNHGGKRAGAGRPTTVFELRIDQTVNMTINNVEKAYHVIGMTKESVTLEDVLGYKLIITNL